MKKGEDASPLFYSRVPVFSRVLRRNILGSVWAAAETENFSDGKFTFGEAAKSVGTGLLGVSNSLEGPWRIDCTTGAVWGRTTTICRKGTVTGIETVKAKYMAEAREPLRECRCQLLQKRT